MALPITITNTFATATGSIPLSQLDTNFSLLTSTINTIGSGTTALATPVITGGTINGAIIGGTTPAQGTFTDVITTGEVFFSQGSPSAVNATNTLTIAQILTNIITTTSATAVSLTLPTGALTDAGILSGALSSNYGFVWNIINLGSASGAITMVAGTGHTYVGSATVAIATSANFLTRKTAASTFVTYRL